MKDDLLVQHLEEFEQLHPDSVVLHAILKGLVERALQTKNLYNEHRHSVSVQIERSEYSSSGDGYTGEPTTDGGSYGCGGPPSQIGHKDLQSCGHKKGKCPEAYRPACDYMNGKQESEEGE